MSKTLMPSLLEMSILKCYNLVVDAVPEIPQKQAESSKPLDLFNHVVSGIIIDGNSIIYLHEKGEAFVSMEELNSYQFQKSDYLDKLQFSEWMTRYGVLLLVITSKYLQKLYAETAHKKAVVLLKNLLKALQCLIPMISGSFFPQIQSETNIFSKDVPHFSKPPKVPMNSNPCFPQMFPQTKILPFPGFQDKTHEMQMMMNRLCSNSSTQTRLYIFNQAEDFGNLTKVPDNSNPFYSQMPPETKIFSKDGQYFVKPSEMQNIVDIFCSETPYKSKILNYLEHFRYLSKVQVNSNSFYPQMNPKSKIFAKDGQYFQILPGIQKVWNRLFSQIVTETKEFARDLEQFRESPKFTITIDPLSLYIPIQKKVFANNLDKFCRPLKIPATIDPFYLPISSQKMPTNNLDHFCKTPEIPGPIDPLSEPIPSLKKISANNLEHFCKPPEIPRPIEPLSVSIPSQKINANNLEHFCKPPEIPGTIDICLPIPPQKTIWNAVNNLEHCCKPNEEQPTLSPVYLQRPAKTKIFRKDSEHSDESLKKLISKPTFQTKRPDKKNFKCVLKMPEMKGSTLNDVKFKRNSKNPRRFEICSLCKEMVTVKKFFGERRFAILERCDCVICYGCIRKETGTSGAVHGPVCCPLCKAKSNTVAASTHWLGSEEKVNFLAVYRKNVEFLNMKLKMGWTSFRTIKNDFGAWVPKVLLAF